MKRITLFIVVFGALALSSSHAQTLFGLPLADSTHMTTGTVAIAADDEDNEKLWSLFYRNAFHELGNLDPVLVSPDRDTIELPEWTTTFTVGSGYLFSTGNHGPGDPDTARHWLFIWDKQGRLMHQLPMDGTGWTGQSYHWRPEGDIISMCDMYYNPNVHVLDDAEKGGFYFSSSSYDCIIKATIYQDSVWVEFLPVFANNPENHTVIGPFGLVHEPTYRGGGWIMSTVYYPPQHSPIFVIPDTATGQYWVPDEDIHRPGIGEIWSMSGNMEEGLWVMGEWPPNDDYRCTAYLFRNPVSVDITFSQVQSLVPSLYPNPTNGWFVLSGLSNKPHDIVIYNLLGQAVYQTRMNGSSAHLEAPWSTGLYFVQVDNQPVLKLQLLR